MKGTKVLVTGAGGFMGSHLVSALLERGAVVTCMTHYNSASSIGNLAFLDKELRSKVKIAPGNIEDSDFVFRTVKDQELVFHLAALIAIPYSYIAPRSYVRTNVEGALNVFESARQVGVKRVIHTSTSEVYGSAIRTPMDEEHPLRGQSPYSATKIAADKLAEGYYRSFGTPIVTVRPFNTFGPRQSARAFIPTIICQALERDEIRLGSLHPERDMTYVADTVKGFLAAATAPGLEGETINLGTGGAHSVGDFAQRILRLLRMNKPIRRDPDRERPSESEVLKLVSDNAKAKRLMGWKPHVSLDDALMATIAFIDEHRALYRPEDYVV